MKKNIIESLIDDYTNKANVLSSGKEMSKKTRRKLRKERKIDNIL